MVVAMMRGTTCQDIPVGDPSLASQNFINAMTYSGTTMHNLWNEYAGDADRRAARLGDGFIFAGPD